MPEFRTATAMVSCTAMMRTAGGLVPCSPLFFGQSGPVETGGSAPLAATASPENVSGATARPGVAPIKTNTTSVTVTGGAAPFQFSWSSSGGLTAVNPASATTAFSGFAGPGVDDEDVFTCTVTDARGATVTTNPVTATISNFGAS